MTTLILVRLCSDLYVRKVAQHVFDARHPAGARAGYADAIGFGLWYPLLLQVRYGPYGLCVPYVSYGPYVLSIPQAILLARVHVPEWQRRPCLLHRLLRAWHWPKHPRSLQASYSLGHYPLFACRTQKFVWVRDRWGVTKWVPGQKKEL
jgi:hypothetical protein